MLFQDIPLSPEGPEEDKYLETQKARTRHHKRAVNALRNSGKDHHSTLADKIENCCKGRRCSSVYCRPCRHRAAKGLETRLTELVGKLGEHKGATFDRLLFITPLFDLAPASDVKRVRATVKSSRAALKRLKRAFPRIAYQGAFEFELINLVQLAESGRATVKFKTIKAMLDWDGEKLTLYPALVLVHAHLLLDAGPYDPVDIRRWLANEFDKAPRQVYCKKVRRGQPLNDLCWKLGSYPFKDRVQYNRSFKSQGYLVGKFIPDSELANLAYLYDSQGSNGFKNLLIGAKASRRRGKVGDVSVMDTNGAEAADDHSRQ